MSAPWYPVWVRHHPPLRGKDPLRYPLTDSSPIGHRVQYLPWASKSSWFLRCWLLCWYLLTFFIASVSQELERAEGIRSWSRSRGLRPCPPAAECPDGCSWWRCPGEPWFCRVLDVEYAAHVAFCNVATHLGVRAPPVVISPATIEVELTDFLLQSHLCHPAGPEICSFIGRILPFELL